MMYLQFQLEFLQSLSCSFLLWFIISIYIIRIICHRVKMIPVSCRALLSRLSPKKLTGFREKYCPPIVSATPIKNLMSKFSIFLLINFLFYRLSISALFCANLVQYVNFNNSYNSFFFSFVIGIFWLSTERQKDTLASSFVSKSRALEVSSYWK